MAALSVCVPEQNQGVGDDSARLIKIPPYQNDFSHITVWFGKNVKLVAANTLPADVKNQVAQEVIFDKHFAVEGVIKMWKQDD